MISPLQAALCGIRSLSVYLGVEVSCRPAYQQQNLLPTAASVDRLTQLAASLASKRNSNCSELSGSQLSSTDKYQAASTTKMSLPSTFQARCLHPNAASLQKAQRPPVLLSLGFSSLASFPLSTARPRDFRFELSTATPCRASSSSTNGVPPAASAPRETATSAAISGASATPEGTAAVSLKHEGNGSLAVETNGNGRGSVTHEDLLRRWAALPQPIGPESSALTMGEEAIPGGSAAGTSGVVSDGETSDGSPGPLWGSVVWASAIDVRRQIFCNRSLNMKSIQAVGFDMDYTLAQYRPDTFETLAYNETIKKLVHNLGYPSEVSEVTGVKLREQSEREQGGAVFVAGKNACSLRMACRCIQGTSTQKHERTQQWMAPFKETRPAHVLACVLTCSPARSLSWLLNSVICTPLNDARSCCNGRLTGGTWCEGWCWTRRGETY